MSRKSLLAGAAMMSLVPAVAVAQARSGVASIDPTRVEVMVVGCPHLSHMPEADQPPHDPVRATLGRYAPDLVVVEWLHPSIDRAQAGNYRALVDRQTQSRLWGIPLSDLEGQLQAAVARVETAKREREGLTAARVALGKRYYLVGDDLNAGYQWWLADRLGTDVAELASLTGRNFEGHELRVFGFEIAREHGLEYLTPFDYQGPDAEWNWMEIVQRVGEYAIEQKHGLRQGDSGWEEAFTSYGTKLEAYAGTGDPAWLDEYGDLVEVREFAHAVDEWLGRRATADAEPREPLDEMRYLQCDAYAEVKREMYYEVYAGISLDGLGRKLVENYERRNRHMADFVEQDIAATGARRVLIIVGGGHKLFLDEIFAGRGYQVVPSEDYMP